MQTYRITRNNQEIGIVAAFSRMDAANAFAKRSAPKTVTGPFAASLGLNHYQAMTYRSKLGRFEEVGQPFAVEGGR